MLGQAAYAGNTLAACDVAEPHTIRKRIAVVQTVHQSCKERIACTGRILTGEFRNIAQQTRPAVLKDQTAVLVELYERMLEILSQYAERLLRRVLPVILSASLVFGV